ncbi:MAG TPA: cellulase family glycosylhydrolase [Bryobacteraceae bacterium]|nr:cellulase family glycosylhydrolase [Bryobacteraceae bacterium]
MRKAAFLTALMVWCTAPLYGQFVGVSNGALTLNQQPFRFGGSNSYALMQEANSVVDQVLATAAANHFTVLRMWCFDDVSGTSGVSFYLQNFSSGAPQYNDGNNGLANVDYAIAKAGQLGIKLIVTLANNWTDYGGMDQYVSARGLPYHDQFFTDATIRQWYKNWIGHVLNHVNTISGVAYKNDPTIMMWELSNEPRCEGSGPPTGLPSSGTCNTQTIVTWIADSAGYIKSIDSNHLVAVGDEGFFCNSAGVPASLNLCGTGVDNVAFSQAANVDVMGFHLYPDLWIHDISWAEQYIQQHITSAKAMGKPVYMGEFGSELGNVRNTIYDDYTNLILENGGAGGLFWDLFAGQPPAANAEALTSFDVEAGSPLLTTMGNFAQMMAAGQTLSLPPVAGDQWAQGVFGDPVTLYPLGNDIAYGGAGIDPASIDLDPTTTGVQHSIGVYGGTFAVVGQSVVFTPSAGFNGTARSAYTVSDTKGNLSNTAYLSVTVPASAAGTATIESFENGTDGWTAQASSGAFGTLTQTSAFHTDGSFGLQAAVTLKGWFGTQLSSPVNLSGRPSMSVDVQLASAGQSAIAFTSGSSGVWCQIPNWPNVPANTPTTVTIQFSQPQLQCFPSTGTPDYTDITAVYVWLPLAGTDYIDNLRAASATTAPPPPVLPSITSISNAAGGQAGAASGSYFSIYGSNFAPAGSALALWSGWVVNGNLPTLLDGVSVTIGGQAAYIYAVTPQQINAVAPGLTDGPAQVVVTTSAGNSVPFTITAASAQPAFFPWGNYAVATRTDYSYVTPNGTLSVPTTAAKAGETVVLWGTGFGNTSPLAPVGQAVPPALYSVSGVSVMLGSTPATVYGTALAPGLAGVYQVAIQVPAGLASGTYNLVATVNGEHSPPISFAVQ